MSFYFPTDTEGIKFKENIDYNNKPRKITSYGFIVSNKYKNQELENKDYKKGMEEAKIVLEDLMKWEEEEESKVSEKFKDMKREDVLIHINALLDLLGNDSHKEMVLIELLNKKGFNYYSYL